VIFKRQSILPGFWPAFSYTALYLSLIVLIPLSAVFLKSSTSGWTHFLQSIRSPNVVAAYRLSFGASLAAGLISVVVGFLIAWVLVRYHFPGKALADALVTSPSRCRQQSPVSPSPASTPKTAGWDTTWSPSASKSHSHRSA